MRTESLILEQHRKNILDAGFTAAFGGEPSRYFSAPGRTEIGGNNTDHQRGRVLAGAVNLDTVAAVRPNGTNTIRIQSKGYPLSIVQLDNLSPVAEEVNTTPALIRVESEGYAPVTFDLKDLSVHEEEKNSTAAIIRGVAAVFAKKGAVLQGFDAKVRSTVLPGSGLSSSAAYEVLIGTIINHLFFDGRVSQAEVAQIGQYAENVFFGKPCGLMDQTASAVGNLVTIDFFDKDAPVIEPVDFDFSACGHALCIIDSGADHADLTDEYAAVPGEMKAVAALMGKEVLPQIPEEDFYGHIAYLRKECGDRAVMRCIHFYQENARVPKQVAALRSGDFEGFLELIKESGRSSWMYLQNVIPAGYKLHQDVALALALCDHYLAGRGAYRVHGGGFAGTVQAFVPMDLLEAFRTGIDAALGVGACHVLSIRPEGGVEAK